MCSMCECAKCHLRIKRQIMCVLHFWNEKGKILFVCCYVKTLRHRPNVIAFMYFWCRCLVGWFIFGILSIVC